MALFAKYYHPPGTMPGTLVEQSSADFTLTLLAYTETSLVEEVNPTIDACKRFLNTEKGVTWIHVQGDPSIEVLRELADQFDIHNLHLEDILNKGQRPKLDIADEQLFLILSLPSVYEQNHSIEQVTLFFHHSVVVSFCSGLHNPFDLVSERLQKSLGKMRRSGPDYLFYSLVDATIDHGYPVLEKYAEQIEYIEETLTLRPNSDTLHRVHQLRRELLLLRRRLWPQREVINQLLRRTEDSPLSPQMHLYFRDCYDHTISILELLETYREMCSGMLEVYLSSVSYRLNEVMRVLTIISTLFIPPTFIVGVYGMNFNTAISDLNMPELQWQYGYIAVWVSIVLLISAMLILFRKHRWL